MKRQADYIFACERTRVFTMCDFVREFYEMMYIMFEY